MSGVATAGDGRSEDGQRQHQRQHGTANCGAAGTPSPACCPNPRRRSRGPVRPVAVQRREPIGAAGSAPLPPCTTPKAFRCRAAWPVPAKTKRANVPSRSDPMPRRLLRRLAARMQPAVDRLTSNPTLRRFVPAAGRSRPLAPQSPLDRAGRRDRPLLRPDPRAAAGDLGARRLPLAALEPSAHRHHHLLHQPADHRAALPRRLRVRTAVLPGRARRRRPRFIRPPTRGSPATCPRSSTG